MHSNAVLAEVTCTWDTSAISAAVVHSARDMLVLEADPDVTLPSIGTTLQVSDGTDEISGRLAEHGRAGRFLVALGDRPVRRSLRMKVCLPATLRGRGLERPMTAEIVDLTTSGARIRGLELPVGSTVTIEFTPPYRHEPVSVRATVAHGTHGAERPWIGVLFRLVALRGGR
jgi:hypothetical protein